MAAPDLSLAELARRLGGEARGQGRRRLRGVRPLAVAGPGDLSFLRGRRYLAEAAASRAGALLVSAELAGEPALEGRDLLVVDDAELALVHALETFYPPPDREPGIHPTAVVAAGCEIDPTAQVGPYAVVGEDSRIGAGAVISAHVVVGKGCRVGAGAVLHPHVVLYPGSEVGERSILHAGVVLGADGFSYVNRREGHVKIPQVGRVVVEGEVEIGANSTIDRAALETTRIGAGSKVDNLVQVGHNAQIGRRCILCGQAGVAGSTRLGDGVVLGGQAGISDHLELGEGVQVAGGSAVFKSVEKGVLAGIPAIDIGRWRRQTVLLARLQELSRELEALKRRMGEEE